MKILVLSVSVLFASSSFSQGLFRLYVDQAMSYTEIEEFEKADFYIEKAIKKYPDSIEGFAHRGAISYYQGEYEYALQDFNYSIDNGFAELHVYRFRGLTYQALGKLNKAEQDLIKVFDADVLDSSMLVELVAVSYEQGKMEAVASYLTTFNKNSQHLGFCYGTIAAIEKRRGNYQKSIDYYSKTIQIDSSNVKAWIGRAACHKFESNKEQMCQDLYEGFARTYDYRANEIYYYEKCEDLLNVYLSPPPQETIIETISSPPAEEK